MKNIILKALIITIVTVSSVKVSAQTSISAEKLAKNAKPKISLKFIDNIEITPETIEGNTSTNEATAKVNVKETTIQNTAATITNNSTIEQCSAIQFKYSMLMNREVESFNNIALYSFIDDWWATRYRFGGTDKNGIDCSAFAGKILSTIYGVSTPRTAAEQYEAAEKITLDNLKEGDLVFFNTRGGISHVGVYLGDNYFVHSSTSAGVTINSLTDDYYNRKFVGGGRINKL